MVSTETTRRYLRHGATCYLQAVRDNPPDDPTCTCGLREAFQAEQEARSDYDQLREALVLSERKS